MSDYVDEYRSGYVGPIPPITEKRVIAHIDPDLTVHDVIDSTSITFTEPRTDREVRITDPETGGQKGQKAEQYSLIPVEAMAQVARVYAHGAEKYSRNNWRLGYDWHLSYDAMQRHLTAFWGGQDLDLDSGLPHLAHAVFHALTLLTYLSDAKYKSKDDRA
jgi:hypothetical protein